MSKPRVIRIATRRSLLALAQARWVAEQLERLDPGLAVELVEVVSSGDKIQDRLLREIGGKALFVKEVEEAIAEGRADIAVHSLKDVPTELPPGMSLIAIPRREDPRDVLISRKPIAGIEDLPSGARVGTASMRRSAMLLRARPDLEVIPLRGNVNTRLSKLAAGEQFDAIVLAAAGLRRLGLDEVERTPMDSRMFVPAAGQGALAIEAPSARTDLAWITEAMDHLPTRLAVEAERAYLDRLGGSCQIPVGAYGAWDGDALTLTGCVADETGDVVQLTRSITRPTALEHVVELGHDLAERVLLAGGATVIAHFVDPATGLSAPATQMLVDAAIARGTQGAAEVGERSLADMRVLVTRSRDQASRLSTLLGEAGARPVEVPCLQVRPVEGRERDRLDEALRALDTYDWIVFTSQNGVKHSLNRLSELGGDNAELSHAKLAVVGAATGASLEAFGVEADLIPETFEAEGLVDAMTPLLSPGASVLVLRAREARQTLIDGLTRAGAAVDDVSCYATGPPPDLSDRLADALSEPIDLLTFASSKTAKLLAEAAGSRLSELTTVPAACIGPITRRTATALGFDVVVQPSTFTIDAFVRSIAEWAALSTG